MVGRKQAQRSPGRVTGHNHVRWVQEEGGFLILELFFGGVFIGASLRVDHEARKQDLVLLAQDDCKLTQCTYPSQLPVSLFFSLSKFTYHRCRIFQPRGPRSLENVVLNPFSRSKHVIFVSQGAGKLSPRQASGVTGNTHLKYTRLYIYIYIYIYIYSKKESERPIARRQIR